MMQKILIIGSPGAGKSTFARRLRDITGLPLYHLDLLWHKADKTTVSREEFDTRLADILALDRWIMDGNFQRTMETRLQACDTVILLDFPVDVCLARAAARVGVPREDLPWVEDGFDPEFRAFIEDFPQDTLPRIYELLETYREGRQVIIFKSHKDTDDFFEE